MYYLHTEGVCGRGGGQGRDELCNRGVCVEERQGRDVLFTRGVWGGGRGQGRDVLSTRAVWGVERAKQGYSNCVPGAWEGGGGAAGRAG